VSNSVLFLLVAVGLSVIGTTAVWLHGRPRRPKSSVDHFAQNLRALSMHARLSEPPSGITPLGTDMAPPASGGAQRSSRPTRSARPGQEQSRPGT
jgi:hypothetical protein